MSAKQNAFIESGFELLMSKAFLKLLDLINHNVIPRHNIEKAKEIITEVQRQIERYSNKNEKKIHLDYYSLLDEKTSFIYKTPGDSLVAITSNILKKERGHQLQKSLIAIMI